MRKAPLLLLGLMRLEPGKEKISNTKNKASAVSVQHSQVISADAATTHPHTRTQRLPA